MIKKDKESYDKYSKLPFSEKKKFREEYYIKVKSKGLTFINSINLVD